MENDLRQEELKLQTAIEASKGADQDLKLKLDTERSMAGKDFQRDGKSTTGGSWSLPQGLVIG